MCVSSKDRQWFRAELDAKRELVNTVLRDMLEKEQQIDSQLKQAMVYTLDAPGKRIRGALVLWVNEMLGGGLNQHARTAAAAIEMVHTYSLVHDDLPAMDDDDMRRSRPTCHVKFDEATAILTGDALLTLGFEVLARYVTDSGAAVKLIRQLANDSGVSGMISGQMADLRSENSPGDIQLLRYIHNNKTAKMFRCAAVMGAITAGASDEQIKAVGNYGLKIGLGFQIADDILDVCGTSEQLGKTAGKDEQAGKLTYPSLVGLDESRKLARGLYEQAMESLAGFGQEADILRTLGEELLDRTR